MERRKTIRARLAFATICPWTLSRGFGMLAVPRLALLRQASRKRPRSGERLIPCDVQCRYVANAGSETADTPSKQRPTCRLLDIRHRCIPYPEGWRLQHSLVQQLKNDPSAEDALVLLEHDPVYTLGTASKLDNVLFNAHELRCADLAHTDSDCERLWSQHAPMLVRTERGGEVTYHGPGQLVAYPILNLHRHKQDLHWYIRSLEQVVIHMLQKFYNLQAERKQGLTGVWVDDKKVCAMGLKVSKWITMHGLALNVDMDLTPFRRIIPCGIHNYSVTSLAAILGSNAVSMQAVREHFTHAFCDVFDSVVLKHSIHQQQSENTTRASGSAIGI